MTICEQIEKTTKTLQERGIPSDSRFEVTFRDGSKVSEENVNWSSISEKEMVGYFGSKKVVSLCKFPVERIEAWHEGLYSSLSVPEGARAYQAIRGDTLIVPGIQRKDTVIGRLIGIVIDGEVAEEHFLNGLQFEVQGMKK